MSKEVYAHEGVTLVCTNGMQTSKMTVQDRGVTIAKGKKIATEMDKPDMFFCKWAGVLAAMLAGLLIAAPFVVAMLAAFIIGMIGAFTFGAFMCKIVLSIGSKWLIPHPTVKIKGQRALVENSELFCPVLGGQISMFFDPAMAAKQQRLNLFKNSIEILGGAFIGRALHILRLNILSQGWMTAGKSFLWEFSKWYIRSFVLSETANLTANLADNLTSDRELNEGLGDNIGSSIPFYGSNKTVPSIIASDYARGFTDPLSIKDEYTHYEQHRKEAWATRKTQSQVDSKQSKIDQKAETHGTRAKQEYLKENPPNQDDTKSNKKRKAKEIRSKNKTKRQEARTKANIEARKQQNNYGNDLNNRYSSRRLWSNASMRLAVMRYGGFAAFFVLDVVGKTVGKKLDREKADRESKARAGVKVVAVRRMEAILNQ